MYAIIELGGHQWKVEPGTQFEVNRLSTAVGSTHTVERVLVAHNGQQPTIGQPYVTGAKVVCEVLDHHLGTKTISYHFRRRENWRKTVGHRQPLTRLVVKDILIDGATAAPVAAKRQAEPKTSTASAKTAVKTSEQPRAARVSTSKTPTVKATPRTVPSKPRAKA